MEKNNLCECGHEEEIHDEDGSCQADIEDGLYECPCKKFRPQNHSPLKSSVSEGGNRTEDTPDVCISASGETYRSVTSGNHGQQENKSVSKESDLQQSQPAGTFNLSESEKMILTNQVRIIGILGIMNHEKYHVKEIREIVEDAHEEIRTKLAGRRLIE